MKCANCKRELLEGSKFCNYCGEEVMTEEAYIKMRDIFYRMNEKDSDLTEDLKRLKKITLDIARVCGNAEIEIRNSKDLKELQNTILKGVVLQQDVSDNYFKYTGKDLRDVLVIFVEVSIQFIKMLNEVVVQHRIIACSKEIQRVNDLFYSTEEQEKLIKEAQVQQRLMREKAEEFIEKLRKAEREIVLLEIIELWGKTKRNYVKKLNPMLEDAFFPSITKLLINDAEVLQTIKEKQIEFDAATVSDIVKILK